MQLVLHTYGTSLSKKDHMFLVHHKDGSQKLAVNNIKSILVAKGARISSDAVIMAIDNEIEIIFTDKSGFPRGRV